LGKRVDCNPHGGETVQAGWAERAFEIQQFERIRGIGNDLGRSQAAEIVSHQRDQAPNHWRIRVRPKVTASIPNVADQPNAGRTTDNAVTGRAFCGRQPGRTARPVDDGREAFLKILVVKQVSDQRSLLSVQRTVNDRTTNCGLKSSGK
jgi:hypothetical protein